MQTLFLHDSPSPSPLSESDGGDEKGSKDMTSILLLSLSLSSKQARKLNSEEKQYQVLCTLLALCNVMILIQRWLVFGQIT